MTQVGPDAEGVDGRVLEEQEVLLGAPLVEGALELVGLAIGDAAKPPDPQGCQSSASQSRVSRISLIRTRKLAA